MKILKFPHKSLFNPTKPVTVFGPELLILFEGMWNAMSRANGMGLSGNQVGLEASMITMIGPSDEKLFVANPKIIKSSVVPANLEEGCLSASGELLIVPGRASWVQVQYQDETGAEHIGMFSGIYSVCIQHEIQHLQGESFMESESLPRTVRKALAKKYGFK